MVGELYPEGGARRDAGFTLFYMGINLGAGLGPLVCSALGEQWNWHYGFAAAGVGMVLGLIQYRLSARNLGEAGLSPDAKEGVRAKDRRLLILFAGVVISLVALIWAGVLRLDPIALARGTTFVIVAVAVVYFGSLLLFSKLEQPDKRRVAVIAILFVASAMFWSGFEQAGSSLNLFAERFTQRKVFDWLIPAGWFQTLGPIFIISLAPAVAWSWVALARHNREPSLFAKFSAGLFLLAAGFLIMTGAARIASHGGKAAPVWLTSTYLLHSIGELCLSPVGLSSVSRLAPKRLVGQLMGTWFLGTSLGNLIAGLLAGNFSPENVHQMPNQYLQIVLTTAGTGLLLALGSRWMKKLLA
jgi:proton-dependent oligopeptide transporter, POT family